MEDPRYFDISPQYSAIYHRFLDLDLSGYTAIRGQLEGPVSFGFNILDQDNRPILYNDDIRPFMYEFLARRANIQLKRLQEKNANAFMFVDEPGLQFLFSALSGYNSFAAKQDMDYFYSLIDRPRGVHLCGNPDWDFLLSADLEVISLDAFTNSEILASYAGSIKKYIERGGVIIWGIVPTNYEPFNRESVDSLIKRLEGIWQSLADKKIDFDLLLSKSLLSPATCCLINPDKEKTVEKAFELMRVLSKEMREKYKLA
jgi:hypothetical protein